MPRYQLAQLNIAVTRAPLDSPRMADFTANIDRINMLADNTPGFVWRLKTEAGDATELRPLGDQTIINLSVWDDVESLKSYVYTSEHVQFMRRRREWFERIAAAHMVLWWIPAGHQPTLDEALARLETLRQNGPTPLAFTFQQHYPAPESEKVEATVDAGATCGVS